ncbi:DUF421 domain-containing protein [Shouchella shacheensis]|uniref:DUF421 domain-containing protein n=1 Tax=Shouchella shacheensis TaxID=1649580 RepID=UPI00073FE7D1|nr:DUF421 domain-containing protein [Shouchella shacheensis]
MEDLFPIIYRTGIMFVTILLFFRITGKKDLGEISVLDVIVTLMIAELSATLIDDTELPLYEGLTPIALLTSFQLLLSKIQVKSQRFRDLIDGQPTIVIKDGQFIQANMQKQGYNLDDIMLQLRDKNVPDIQEVNYAILESSGTLSVFQKNSQTSFTLPFIMDETIQHAHLQMMGKTEEWLYEELAKHGYTHEKGIFYCSYTGGQLFVQEKDGTSA